MAALIPLLILGVFSLSVSDKIKAGSVMSGYFAVLMFSVNFLYFAALINLLKPAAILLFSGLIAYSLADFVKSDKKSVLNKRKNDLYFLLYNISCAVFALIFSIKKPSLYYWDELNIWGPSAKAVKLFDRLYSIGINPCTNDRNYPPGNAVLNYLFSFFDLAYKEHVLLISYAFLFLACFAVGAFAVYKLTGSHTLGIGSYFVFVISPFVAGNHLPLADYSSISYAYGTTMVDFNLAVVFLGIMALYFAEKGKLWYLLPAVYILTVKKNGIFFALLALCVICCFELFTFKIQDWKLKKAVLNIIVAVVVILTAYSAWNVHLDAYKIPRREKIYNLKDTAPETEKVAESAEKPAEEKPAQASAPVNKRVKPSQTTIKAIFIPSLRTERYNEILNEMKWYFVNNKEVVFCTDIVLIAFLFVLGTIAAIKGKKGLRLAMFFASAGFTAGCFVDNLVIAYQMQFYNDMMVEYPRYMLSYYFSWIYLIILMFVTSKGVDERAKNMFLTVVLAASLVYVYGTGLDYTVMDAPHNPVQWRKNVTANTEKINGVLKEKDSVYLVYPDQDGLTYIRYRYNMLPAYTGIDTLSTGIDFSINFREKIDYTSDRQYYNVASPQTFTDVMNTYFDYIYVVKPDEEFYHSYSHLFSDGMTQGTLYRVTEQTVPMQAVVI